MLRAAVVLIPCAAALGFEGAARLEYRLRNGHAYADGLAYVPDPNLVYRPNPRHHSWEGRGEELLGELPEPAVCAGSLPCLWILGGSTSEPRADASDWPAVAQGLLRGRYVVRNLARSGYGTGQMRWLYAHRVRPRPRGDVVVVFEGWNGRGALTSPYGWRPVNTVSRFDRWPQHLSAFLINHSAFYGRLWHAVNGAFSEPCSAAELPETELQEWAREFGNLLREASQRHRVLVVAYPGLAMRDDARGSLLPEHACIASRWQEQRAFYERRIALVRAMTEGIAAGVLDPTPAYRALSPARHVALFTDAAHQTVDGNRLLGMTLGKLLSERLPAEPPSGGG